MGILLTAVGGSRMGYRPSIVVFLQTAPLQLQQREKALLEWLRMAHVLEHDV